MREMSYDSDPEVRTRIAYNAGNLEEPEHFSLLLDLMKDSSPEVRAAVAQEAGSLKNPEEALYILRQTADDEDRKVRSKTAASLAAIGTAEGLDMLYWLIKK